MHGGDRRSLAQRATRVQRPQKKVEQCGREKSHATSLRLRKDAKRLVRALADPSAVSLMALLAVMSRAQAKRAGSKGATARHAWTHGTGASTGSGCLARGMWAVPSTTTRWRCTNATTAWTSTLCRCRRSTPTWPRGNACRSLPGGGSAVRKPSKRVPAASPRALSASWPP